MIEKNYDDIINLPHYTSKKHPRMSLEARSAQFAPFSALSGYEEAIKETARLTDKRIEIDDSKKEIINLKLNYIQLKLKEKNEIAIKYFEKDTKKAGGRYIEKRGIVKKINLVEQYIVLTDNTKIDINEIIELTSELFKEIEY